MFFDAVAPGLSVGRGLAPAEGCDASGSEGASPFPTFVLPDNLYANMPCGYYTMKQKHLLARRRKLRLFHFYYVKMSLAALLLLSQKVCDSLGSLCFCEAVNITVRASAR